MNVKELKHIIENLHDDAEVVIQVSSWDSTAAVPIYLHDILRLDKNPRRAIYKYVGVYDSRSSFKRGLEKDRYDMLDECLVLIGDDGEKQQG